MANVGDVLLPILGGIAGTSPYLGSGIRTALTVDQALKRRKWQEGEATRRQEEDEAKAAEKRADEELEAQNLEDLYKEIDDYGGDDASILRVMARSGQAGKVSDILIDRKEAAREPVPRVYSPEEIGTVGADMRGALGDDTSFSRTFKTEGGTTQVHFGRPGAEAQPEQHDPGFKSITKAPWIFWGTGEDGKPIVHVDEELKAQYKAAFPEETAQDDTEEKIEAATIKVLKAKEALEKYSADQELGFSDGPITQEAAIAQVGMTEEPGYMRRKAELRAAERQLEMLLAGEEPEPTEKSSDSTNVAATYYDEEGNRVPVQ